MTSLLARLASYPRKRYMEEGHDLDIAFITNSIWVMSLPSVSWPERLYRNNLHHVKVLLDRKAGTSYRVFDFRAEGAGYADSDFDGRVSHYPFVDHQPPPFALLPQIVEGIHRHVGAAEGNVAVIHCKAGKGRSGLSACSYLITHAGFTEQGARSLFTQKRMRAGFGEGLSIPSQVRYLGYVQQWNEGGRRYVPRRVRIESVTVRGLRAGCRLSLREFKQQGTVIQTLHDFSATDWVTKEGGDTMVAAVAETKSLEMDDDVCVYLSKGNAFAHFWFNATLEAAKMKEGQQSFSIVWEEVDGWKGTRWRGAKAYDSVSVQWTFLS
ncbi:Putative uncharacterized protein [Taphrina deformans PYCC 5710]|uniref:phosphatidylinositol-3,4,5-trisphosphate 3-phosphatase n=1 Tax=Taphrina deformans (strain PYCC 5710 / ATCC 11124 / CBS 356.35 / IMI 108563 / JCM 9778 / NBRC 8474) TaxID=1097556 RepID=R4X970_TAPDE|nr:Putative uncharacterized protein [Taphrina deformans PYCC 5710]|eukprot:CCG81970.1 Putative uncharacterized protein [Taphrina deformans PYCC 5710]